MITNELISEIKSKINDNQKQAITGGILQGVLVDMVNGLTTTGLTFLGILSPGDPAPSNEPTKGYYLSFQKSTIESPYFNNVYLHRYCFLIWTQDEKGRWKFKRIKYEDHRPAPAVVIGKPLPIRCIDKVGTCILCLGLDGTRTHYAMMGPTNFRYKHNASFKRMGPNLPCFNNYFEGIVKFPIEDNGKVFRDIEEARQYIREHQSYSLLPLSTKNYSRKNNTFVWTPQRWKRQAVFLRKYHGMKNYDPDYAATNPNRGNLNLLIRVKMTNRHIRINKSLESERVRRKQTVSYLKSGILPANSCGELRAFKRYKWIRSNVLMVHACGFSDEVRYFNTTRARLSRTGK